jgi:N-acyl-D-amino-acid deacylase
LTHDREGEEQTSRLAMPAQPQWGKNMRMKRFLTTQTAAGAVLALFAAPAPAQTQSVDTLITGGTIYDGSDGKPFVGDVAVSGDKIVYVGPAGKKFNAKKTVDAKGMVVSPGFIDGHSHSQHFLDNPDT